MSISAKKWIALACAAVVAVALLVLAVSSSDAPSPGGTEGAASAESDVRPRKGSEEAVTGSDAPVESVGPSEEGEGEQSEDDEEKLVDAFDSLTDRWMEKERGEVAMKDVDEFVAAFKSVPDGRKEECLQRALNLVSDDHVLLLAGILFDKAVAKEYVELVFNDVLNRDEDVKKLILPRIYKDKTHPCWADTAWILDVTGETPNKEDKK